MNEFFWIVLCSCVVVFTAIAAVWDVRTKKIPNVPTVSALVAALAFHLIRGAAEGGLFSGNVGDGLVGAGKGLLMSLAGFATGFGILFVLWLIGGGGGGDVKLMGALGAWLGPVNTLVVFMISTLLVVAISLIVLTFYVFRIGFKRTKKRFREPIREKPKKGAKARRAKDVAPEVRPRQRRIMPYGVPVALATWCVLAFNARIFEVIRQILNS